MMFPLCILPFIAYATAAGLKTIHASIKAKQWTLKGNGLGGMPSSHNAFTSSIATIIAWFYGVNGPLFALSIGLLFIVAIDAVDLRQRVGQHAKAINTLQDQNKSPLRTRIGHKPSEIFAGLIWGTAVTTALLALGLGQ